MQKDKRLRVFAGPNGSGKSTLFDAVVKQGYNVGYFINADKIEAEMAVDQVFKLEEVGIVATNTNLNYFKRTKEAISLFAKATTEGKKSILK